MDCPQFEGMTFADNKEINKILREQLSDGLILTMRAVGKTKKFFEISFLNEEGRVAALNRPFIINDKEIVVSLTLGPGARIVRVGITGIPVLDNVSNCNRLIEILSPCRDISKLGLHYMPSGHWFNGRGFTTLNCATDKTYNGKLKHQMPFYEHRNITLVRSSMGVVCKEYRSDEHIKVDCPVYRERNVKRCDKCQSPNHAGDTTMAAAADQDGHTVAHSDSQAPLDQGQHGAQAAVTKRKPLNWAGEGIPQFHYVEVDESTMKTDLNGAGLANADQDDGKQTDGEETGKVILPAFAVDHTALQQGGTSALSSGPSQMEGQRQPQLNKDGSLNSWFSSRSGRSIKSPNRLYHHYIINKYYFTNGRL